GNLSERQKTRLLGLLDETTRTQVLEVAADVVEKKRQNLAALESRELGLSPYEREISLMILQGKSIADIAAKLKKNTSAITSARTVIRSKLGLETGDNLYDALLKLVETTSAGEPSGKLTAERQADE
ncbi:helix-turn-helix transcriptional regulator, partial [Rikenella microfusus]